MDPRENVFRRFDPHSASVDALTITIATTVTITTTVTTTVTIAITITLCVRLTRGERDLAVLVSMCD